MRAFLLGSPVNVLISIFFRKFHKELGHFVSRCCCSKLGAILVNDISIKRLSFDFPYKEMVYANFIFHWRIVASL